MKQIEDGIRADARQIVDTDFEIAAFFVLAEGDKVVMFYGSANRDETAFEEPERFDVTRDPNRHVGFGGGGPHFCMGAAIARAQIRALFSELLAAYPGVRGRRAPLHRRQLRERDRRAPARHRRARLAHHSNTRWNGFSRRAQCSAQKSQLSTSRPAKRGSRDQRRSAPRTTSA